MRHLTRAALSLGTALLLAGCRSVDPATPHPPARIGRPVAPAAFGPLSGPDALLVPDSTHHGPTPIMPTSPPAYHPTSAWPNTAYAVIAFVVDTAGRVVPGTAAVIQTSAPQFARAVCRSLPRSRYRPAMVDGRARRALVVNSWGFGRDEMPPAADLRELIGVMRTMSPTEVVETLTRSPGCP